MLTIIIHIKNEVLPSRQMQFCRVQFGRWSRLGFSPSLSQVPSGCTQLYRLYNLTSVLLNSELPGTASSSSWLLLPEPGCESEAPGTIFKNTDSQGPTLAGSDPGGLG